jgi:activator of 2-hydroxyglutaryl-CoA dehydratase
MSKVTVTRNSILGIDIGSVSLYIVQLDTAGKILSRYHQFHKGNVRSAFSDAGKQFDLSQVNAVACTSSSTCLNKKQVLYFNTQVAIMAAARSFCPGAVSVLHIGAEKC